jgi:hypothetical protein
MFLYNIDYRFNTQLWKPNAKPPGSCLRAKTGSACQHGLRGILSFNTSFAIAASAERLIQIRSKTDDPLIHILGSAVRFESQPIPRNTSGTNLHVPDRMLSLSPRTQVLRDRRTEEAIGWYISDSHIGLGEKQEVICANIAYWRFQVLLQASVLLKVSITPKKKMWILLDLNLTMIRGYIDASEEVG